MPPAVNLVWFAAAVLASSIYSQRAAAETDFGGVWVVSHRVVLMAAKVSSEVPGDQEVIQIDQDGSSGRITGRKPDLTPDMTALGFYPTGMQFDGRVEGDVASGTEATFKIPFWPPHADCPQPAGFRFRSERRLEYVGAVPGAQRCLWTFEKFPDFDESTVQHLILTLEPLFVVREVRFIDQPADGSAGKRITSATPDQSFRVEVEFEVAPPAAIYVNLGESLVTVSATSDRTVFRSDAFTLNDLRSRPGR